MTFLPEVLENKVFEELNLAWNFIMVVGIMQFLSKKSYFIEQKAKD